MASGVMDLDAMPVFGGGDGDDAEAPDAGAGAGAGDDSQRSKNNDYLGKIADKPLDEVNLFSIARAFGNVGLDFSQPETKLEWRDEVSETLKLVERFLLDATASLRRIMEALQQYDEGKMTILVKFSFSTEERTIEKALREPAHAVKGAAATVTFDRVALACRAIELPLKDVADKEDTASLPTAERRAFVDSVLGADRGLIRRAWEQLEIAVHFVHDDLLKHLLEHRCGRSSLEEAQAYIPTDDELDDGAEMPEGEPEDYNHEDWGDDIADVSEDIDDMLARVPRDLVATALAEFPLPAAADAAPEATADASLAAAAPAAASPPAASSAVAAEASATE